MNANTPACPNLPVPTLQLREGALWLEERPLTDIAARFGTPRWEMMSA